MINIKIDNGIIYIYFKDLFFDNNGKLIDNYSYEGKSIKYRAKLIISKYKLQIPNYS